MAHFYGTMRGNRGECSRGGSKDSGIQAHPRGWNLGVRVNGYFNITRQTDQFDVIVSAGSSGGGHSYDIATVYIKDGRRYVAFRNRKGILGRPICLDAPQKGRAR